MSEKTAELTGARLDYWVAKAEGFPQCGLHTEDGEAVCFLGPVAMHRFIWAPSTAWEQGGPIIERACIDVSSCGRESGEWSASVNEHGEDFWALEWVTGPTPLIAAMRAYVASKFGEEVSE